jgi:hypothetical protein
VLRLFRVALVVVIAVGVGVGTSIVAQGSTGSLSTYLALDQTSVKVGGVIHGVLVVTNSGLSVDLTHTCEPQFAVGLATGELRPNVAVALPCSTKALWIRHGVNRFPFVVSTSYGSCSEPGGTGASASIPKCLPGPRMPLLPAGSYRATFVSVGFKIPVPTPVLVALVR